MRNPRAFVTGVAGIALDAGERRFLAEASPWGLILFRRNIGAPDDVRRLTDDFRTAVGWNAPVLIDQEGGRVQRLAPPHWRRYPSAARLARLAAGNGDGDLVVLVAGLIAGDLRDLGITVDCAPCLDLGRPETTGAIGDRSFGADPIAVADLGRRFAGGLLAGGVLPVIKHIPGHGRAVVDSHHELPRIEADLSELEASDFAPFRMLADLPAAMTAHLVYAAVDGDQPVTLSSTAIARLVRGHIGFAGLLFSDDLSMKALQGSLATRARGVIAAGCDIALYCAGVPEEAEAVAAAVPELTGASLARADRALAAIGDPAPFDRDAALARLQAALAAEAGSADI